MSDARALDAVTYAANVAEIEQVLAADDVAIDAGRAKTEIRGPQRVVIDREGETATASYYTRWHENETGSPVQLAYSRTTLLHNDRAWSIVEHDCRTTGSADGPQFLADALRPQLYSTRSLARSQDPAAQRAADLRAVRDLLVTYGIAADSGSADLVGALYTRDSHFDIEGAMQLVGRAQIIASFARAPHQTLMPWSCHTTGPALVHVDGDRASSTHYARTYVRNAEVHDDRSLWRFSINRWELVRDADGCWLVKRRTSRTPECGELGTLARQGLLEHHPIPTPADAGAAGRLVDLTNVEQHVASLGFALDTGEPGMLEGLFAGNPDVAFDGQSVESGAALVDAISGSATGGVGHPTEPPVIAISGNEATASHLLSVYGSSVDNAYPMVRLLRAEWSLVRAGDGWTGARLHLADA